MRKLTQRRAVDYTSTVVRYMQVVVTYVSLVDYLFLLSITAIVHLLDTNHLQLLIDSHVAAGF